MIQRTSRDNARTPMQWSADENAGFTYGAPWLKVNGNYTEVNVAAEAARENGVLAFWRRMISLRKELPALKNGSFKSLYEGAAIYAYERVCEGERLVAILNMTAKAVKLPAALKLNAETVIASGDGNENALSPFEFRLMRTEA